MRKWKLLIKNSCISFTVVIFLLNLLITFRVFPSFLDGKAIYELLAINFLIWIGMEFTDRLPLKSDFLKSMVALSVQFLVVFLLGGVGLHLFSFRLSNILLVSVLLVTVYFLVRSLYYIRDKSDAKQINFRIKNRSYKDEK